MSTLVPSAADLGYDPWDPAFVADPYPALARLREQAPVLYDERTDQWLVSRHADVNALLRDRRLGRSYRHVATHEEWGRTPPPADQAPFWDLLDLQLIDMEPPDHTRLRRLVTKAFTPRTVEGLRPRIETIVDGVVGHARDLGEFDLIADLMELVPVTVIAELLGIPEADRHLLRPWSADMTLMFELNPSPGDAAPGDRGERRVRGVPPRPRPGATRPSPATTCSASWPPSSRPAAIGSRRAS